MIKIIANSGKNLETNAVVHQWTKYLITNKNHMLAMYSDGILKSRVFNYFKVRVVLEALDALQIRLNMSFEKFFEALKLVVK